MRPVRKSAATPASGNKEKEHKIVENTVESFSFTYSAVQQQELQKIREKYLPKVETPLEQLRRLDAGVTKRASMIAISIGIFSSLVLGTGMSCCMVWGGAAFVPGIVVGLLGILGVCLSYPIYARVTAKEREKIAPEILRLTDNLMK